MPLGHQAARHPHMGTGPADVVNLPHQGGHAHRGIGVYSHRNDDAVAGRHGRDAADAVIGRAVDDHVVVGVVLHQRGHKSPQQAEVRLCEAQGTLQLKVPQGLGGRDQVQKGDVSALNQVSVLFRRLAQRSGQSGPLQSRGQQGDSGVALAVGIDDQHPATHGGQYVGEFNGSDGLPHPALSVDDGDGFHIPASFLSVSKGSGSISSSGRRMVP